MRRKLRVAGIVFMVAMALGSGVFFYKGYFLPKPKLENLLQSGNLSILSADYVEVRLHTPKGGALIENLNTIVVKNLRILSNASAAMSKNAVPTSGWVLLSDGPRLADYAALALHDREEGDRILKERSIIPRSEGVSYQFGYMIHVDVKIYELQPGGVLKYYEQVSATHILIKH